MMHARGVLKLAPGVRLSVEDDSARAALWKPAAGKVHLNRHAHAILELCDGSRSPDRVVIDAMLRSAGGLRVADIRDFLAAAKARGWLIEVR
jgi:hypothetical protein